MITVYGRRNSVNVQKVMWTLGELDLEYERHDVGGSHGYPADYDDMNPNHTVPTITDGDLNLWESNACVRYLARTYGANTLWPGDGAVLATADQWMEWSTANVGGAFLGIFFNLIRIPADQADQAAIAAGVKQCATLFTRFDQHLADRDFVAGTSLTMGDIPLGAMAYRYLALDIERPELANVQRWYERLSSRTAYRKHVMIPFGTNVAEWDIEEAKNAGIQ